MAYIYKIINDINDKIYIGKTEFSIETRFKEHCCDAFREHYGKRPLYNAMRKYGIEHFHIELIEETNEAEEREKFWIKFYNSYYDGYNATFGGEGKPLIDYDLILELWNKNKMCTEIANITGHDAGQISKILHLNDITTEEISKRANHMQSKAVLQIDKESNTILNRYKSCIAASISMIEQGYTNCKPSTGSTHISEVCRGKRKTFAGFIWRYDN